MKQYLDILRDVLENGSWKEVRTKERCLTDTHKMCSFDLRDGFPLLTERFIPFKSICVELEGFLKGVTDRSWYEERKCRYWSFWSNPKSDDPNDLGAIYPWQWRKFGESYGKDNGVEKGCDQIQSILDKLISNPNDRRMLCIAFNPNQLDNAALPACHYSFGLTKIDNYLDFAFTMRSWDLFLGAPSNIASYAILLHLFAKHASLIPRKLTGFGIDCHIYENHIEQSKELLNRESCKLPSIKLLNDSFWSWDHTKIELIDYKHRGKLIGQVAV